MAVVKLTQTIEAYGETVHQITLRAPTGQDISVCGFPMRFTQDADTETMSFYPVASVIHAYIVRLGDLPKGAVNQLCPEDFNECMGEVLGFFGQATPGSPASPRTRLNDTTISPGSGNSRPPSS
jgi:tail assembly chaperone E/41/14-like protein